jgi:hypothetical protein
MPPPCEAGLGVVARERLERHRAVEPRPRAEQAGLSAEVQPAHTGQDRGRHNGRTRGDARDGASTGAAGSFGARLVSFCHGGARRTRCETLSSHVFEQVWAGLASC